MKKIQKILLPISLFLFLWCVTNAQQTGTGSYTYTFNIGTYSIDTVDLSDIIPIKGGLFYRIEMSDEEYGYVADPGYPALPQLTKYFRVPQNATNVRVSMKNPTYKSFQIPSGYIEPYIEYGPDGTEGSVFQAAYYSSGTTPFVNTYFSVEEPSFVMNEQAVGLTVLPFRYLPKEKKVTMLTKAQFVISWQTNGTAESKSIPSTVKGNFLQDIFENYTPAKSDRKDRLLIVTAPKYESMLSVFAEYKRNIGLDVEVVNTGEIGSTASDIKEYIKTTSFNPDFVLLVGSIHEIPQTEGVLDGSDKDKPLTDQGYRQLKGSDKVYGDVFLGRWPVSDVSGLANIINKTIYMETGLNAMPREAVFLAGYEDNSSMENSFERGHNKAIKNGFDGYVCKKYYQSSSSKIEALKTTYPVWFVYSGHGSLSSMAYKSNEISIRSTFFNRENLYPFIFSFACLTGNYSSSSYIPNILNKSTGPILFFGSTVTTYCNSDVAIESKILGKSFSKKYIGSMITAGMTKYRKRFWSVLNMKRTKRYMKSYNILGDPSCLKEGLENPVENYTFSQILQANNGMNLNFSCTQDIFINVGITTDKLSSLQFGAVRNLTLKGACQTLGSTLFSAENITIRSGTEIKQGSVMRISADSSITIEDGVTISPDSEVSFLIQ